MAENTNQDEMEESWTLEELRETHADEILADCPDCEFGNLKSMRVGYGNERVLACSFYECGRIVKSFHDDWPDIIPKSFASVDEDRS